MSLIAKNEGVSKCGGGESLLTAIYIQYPQKRGDIYFDTPP